MTLPGGRAIPGPGLATWSVAVLTALRSVPWYPAALALSVVLAFHFQTGVHVLASLRAAGLAVLGAGLLQAILTAILRDRPVAAIASVFLVAFAFAWQALRAVVSEPGLNRYLLFFVPSIAILGLALLRRRAGPGRLFHPAEASMVLGRLAPVLFAPVLLLGVTSGSLAQDLRDLGLGGGRMVAHAAMPTVGRPDMWLIMLDGHPRRDTLQRLFAYDDAPFLEALAARGLQAAPRSRSNYPATSLTLASLFHMQPLEQIDALTRVLAEGHRPEPTFRTVINDNPVFEILRDRGYEIVTSAPPYEDVTLHSADRYLDDGQFNEFELHLLRSTLLLDIVDRAAPDFLSEQQRGRLLSAFRHVSQEAERVVPFPRLLFIHVAGPHMPAVFAADGAPVRATNSARFFSDTLAGSGMEPVEFERAYVAQLAYLDGLAIEAVDEVVARDPDAVVVIFSDHGSRSRFDLERPDTLDFDEAFGNLFAARTPGHDRLFPDDVTPVNLFPVLLNTYFGLDLPTWPDRTYFEPDDAPDPDVRP